MAHSALRPLLLALLWLTCACARPMGGEPSPQNGESERDPGGTRPTQREVVSPATVFYAAAAAASKTQALASSSSIASASASTAASPYTVKYVTRYMTRPASNQTASTRRVNPALRYRDPDDPALVGGGKGKGTGKLIPWPGLMGASASTISYYDGPQMVNPITVYFILYGKWDKDYGESVLKNGMNSLGDDSPTPGPSLYNWWRLVTDYYQKDGKPVSSKVKYGGSITINKGYKTALGDGFGKTKDDIKTIVTNELKKGTIPLSPDNVYVVLTATDVVVGDNLNGLCGFQGYCGWHGATKFGKTLVQYALVGDPTDQCNQQCGANDDRSKTPNGYYRIDSMMSTILHEVSEAATDPVLGKGWLALDADKQSLWETADLCNGQFTESGYPALQYGPGKKFAYNIHGMDGFKYLVQTFPDKKTQKCVLQKAGGKSKSRGKGKGKEKGKPRKSAAQERGVHA